MGVDDGDELAVLKIAAQHAYERARDEVINQFPVGTHIRERDLSTGQLDAMRSLYQADSELAEYRRQQHGGAPPD
jgi:hypothetical protein